MDQPKEISYSGYLQLDRILQAQQPLSSAHDEMLFIIQHQTSELWMKLAIHELNASCRLIAADDLQPAFKTLSRVSRILEQLNSAWDVLRTMTPSEYTQFRGLLGQSSGLQSWQYRMIEFLVGNKNAATIHIHAPDDTVVERLEAVRRAPSIYDLTLRLLHRRGLGIDQAVIERDVSVSHVAHDSVVKRMVGGLSEPGPVLGIVRARRKAGGFRRLFPPLAFQPCDDGRTDHRIQARHRRFIRRVLSAKDAGRGAVPRALAGQDATMTADRHIPDGIASRNRHRQHWGISAMLGWSAAECREILSA